MIPAPVVSEIDCAYAAGLVDGEGTIGIAKRPPRRGVPLIVLGRDTFCVRVVVANTVREPLDWLAERFGGSIIFLTHQLGGLGYCYRWSASHQVAAEFLRRVAPYLIIKRSKALLALQFEAESGGRRGTRADALFERQRQLHAAMLALTPPHRPGKASIADDVRYLPRVRRSREALNSASERGKRP